MAENVIILASLSTNADPERRTQVFEVIPVAYETLAEAVADARKYHLRNFARGRPVLFREYRAKDPDGATQVLLEVHTGEDMKLEGLYKIIAGKFVAAEAPGAH